MARRKECLPSTHRAADLVGLLVGEPLNPHMRRLPRNTLTCHHVKSLPNTHRAADLVGLLVDVPDIEVRLVGVRHKHLGVLRQLPDLVDL